MKIIDDHPLTSLKMSVEFVDGITEKTNVKHDDLIGECDCTRNHHRANLILNWNGREYSVEEVKALIAAIPVEEIMDDIRRYQGHSSGRRRKFEHPMLNLIGRYKIWPK